MERLTKKSKYQGIYYDTFPEIKWGNADSYQRNNALILNKLGKFEDFMEENGYDTIDTLKKDLDYNKGFANALITEKDVLITQNKVLRNENKQFENKFNEFKEYLEKKMASSDVRICDYAVYKTVYNKLLRVKGGLHDKVR